MLLLYTGPPLGSRAYQPVGAFRETPLRDILACSHRSFTWPVPRGIPPVGSYPTLSPITCERQRSYPIHRLVCSLLHLTWRRACAHPSLGLLGRAASATSPDFALRFGPKPWNAATGRTARTGWIIPQEPTLELLAFPRLRRTILVGVRRSSTLSVLFQRFCQRGSLPISGSNQTPGPSSSITPS